MLHSESTSNLWWFHSHCDNTNSLASPPISRLKISRVTNNSDSALAIGTPSPMISRHSRLNNQSICIILLLINHWNSSHNVFISKAYLLLFRFHQVHNLPVWWWGQFMNGLMLINLFKSWRDDCLTILWPNMCVSVARLLAQCVNTFTAYVTPYIHVTDYFTLMLTLILIHIVSVTFTKICEDK